MNWLLHLSVMVALIAINALYVASEFAAVGARRSRVRPLAEAGQWLAKLLLPYLEDPRSLDRYIAASQVGITLSGLVLGAYAQATVGAYLRATLEARAELEPLTALSVSTVIVLLALTMTQVLLGELVPKYLALQFPTRVALLTVLPMWWTGKVLGGFIAALNGTAAGALKLLGFKPSGHHHVHSPEELELLFAESHEGGLLEPTEHGRLRRALRLSKRKARDLMVPRLRVSAVAATTSIDEALDYIVASPYTRLPVYDGAIDNIIGLLHTKDLAQRSLSRPPDGAGTVADLVRPALSVSADVSGDQLLKLLRERRCHQAIVRDQRDQLVGFVTLEDVLAELVGRVGDEFKG
ncbi:MAG: hemolysin family protein [Vicinamibacterales bacterium]